MRHFAWILCGALAVFAVSAQVAPPRAVVPDNVRKQAEEDAKKDEENRQQLIRQFQQQQGAQLPPAQTPQEAPAPAANQATPEAAAPAQGAATAAAESGAPQSTTAGGARLTASGGFMLNGASLTELIDILARQLKINYMIDPRVKGSVTIYTYGEVKPVDLMPLLDTILHVNGAAMVKVGDLYRIVPVGDAARQPMDPMVNADQKTLPDDDRLILNLVFLKYATSAEMFKLIAPFLGEGATASTYDPANLLIILDNSRNMRRTMELLALFDSDSFAGQRVKLFDIAHSNPSDLVKDLDTVFKAYALSDKSAVKFIPVDRINTIIAVASNPGVFDQVATWIQKLDIEVKSPAGTVDNYVYRLKYGSAATVAMAIMALYTGDTMSLVAMANMANSSAMMSGGFNGGAYGGGSGMYGGGGMYGGPYAGGTGYGPTYGGGGNGYGGGYGTNPYAARPNATTPAGGGPAASGAAAAANRTGPGGTDLTGSYLGSGGAPGAAEMRIPHIIPNPFDNTLLIQGTPQEYRQILDLLRQLDVPPRQVLIEAKIMEVDLSGALNAGVTSYLEQKDSGGAGFSRALNAVANGAGLTLTGGALVLKSHELLASLTTGDLTTHTRVVASPSIIATDSIPATLNVGDDVPVLTSASAGGIESGGTSVVTNSIGSRSTGVTLNVMARVNSSGVITMVINQDVSTPEAPPPNSPSSSSAFQRRSFSTQLTVQDGDTVAIGGIIQEQHLQSSGGVPFLDRLPVVGLIFGGKTDSKKRTELIVFLTPRVIYDTNRIQDATEEIKTNMKHLQKLMQQQ